MKKSANFIWRPSGHVLLVGAEDSRLTFAHPVPHSAPALSSHVVRWLPVEILHFDLWKLHLLVHAGLRGLHAHRVIKELHWVLGGHEERLFDWHLHGHFLHGGLSLVLAPHLTRLFRHLHVSLQGQNKMEKAEKLPNKVSNINVSM